VPHNPQSNLTVKQQREARRAEKVAAMKQQQATQKRNQLIGLIAAGAAAVAIVAVIIVVIVTSSTPRLAPADIVIEGLEEFPGVPATHVDTAVDYEAEYGMNPPAGGDHSAAWLNCGVYSEPQPSENAVHSLEHGAVWVTYDPSEVDEAGVNALRDAVPSTYIILSPYEGLPSPVVASAWGAQVALDSPSDERLDLFIQKYWKSADAPEPGALCTGAIDGPGRVS
jgi:hypothetical protein